MKPSLIFLHGALGTKEQFDSLQIILDEHFSTWSFNFEGHGGNETDKLFSLELFQNNLLDFIRENKIDRPNIFGYSMGGYVALKTAIDYPELFDKIITYGTKFNWTPESAEKEIRMMNPDIIEQKVPAFAESLKKKHYSSDWKIVLKKTVQMMIDLGNGKAIQTDSFSKIKNDVLIIIGSEDKMVSFDESEKVANAIPLGRLLILKDGSHPIELVDEKNLARLIIEFIPE